MSTRKILRTISTQVRGWWWGVAGEKIAGLALLIAGHWRHYLEQDHHLNHVAPITTAHRAVGLLSLVYAVVSFFQGVPRGLIATKIDVLLPAIHLTYAGQPLATVDAHQWLAIFLALCSLGCLFCIYELPIDGVDLTPGVNENIERQRVKALLYGQQAATIGMMMYWIAITIIICIAAWGSHWQFFTLFMAGGFHWYVRRTAKEAANIEFVVEEAFARNQDRRLILSRY